LLCDGLCEDLNTVFEFYGCFFHGCDKCKANCNTHGTLKEKNPLNGNQWEEVVRAPRESEKKGRIASECGYKVSSI